MDNSPKNMNRRQFIKAVGAGAAIVALGNCSTESNPQGPGDDVGNGENSSSSSAAGNSNATSSSSEGNPSSSSSSNAASSSSRGSSSSSNAASSSSSGGSSSAANSSSSRGSSSSSSRGSSSSSSRGSSSSSSGGNSGKSKVYFTSDISPAGLMLAYNALNQQPSTSDKVAVKLSIGEPVSNYLRPALIGELVQSLQGTIVECNTLYPGGARDNTASHKQVARDHGYYGIAEVDILDEDGSMTLTVTGGTRLQENKVGKNFAKYNYFVVLSHFKGHTMGGFGGALKNISIGIASRDGKEWIHKAGNKNNSWTVGGNQFLEAMAEAGKSVVDSLKGKILYINVMNQLSVDCDCFNRPEAPKMSDIGILSSLDPVALDQACVDLVYNAPKSSSSNNADLIERMESRNGIRTVEHAAAIGLGSREYDLINL